MAKVPKYRIDFDPDENPGFERVDNPPNPPADPGSGEYQIVTTSSQAFNDLQRTIVEHPALLKAPGVTDNLNALKTLDKNLKEVEKILGSLTDAIDIFTSQSSNVCDMISGGFEVLSSVVRVAGVLTGSIAITAPIARALDLVASIFGYFGAPANETDYYAVLAKMMDDANSSQFAREIQTHIAGDIADIYSCHITVTNLIETVKKDMALAPTLLTIHTQITNDYFRSPGIHYLGAAVKNIEDNTLKDQHNNWGETAETFYMANKLIAMKILFYLDGVNYFNLAETDEQKKLGTSRLNTLLNDSNAFRDKYFLFCKTYFGTPSLTNAAITHNIYRLDLMKFELIARLNDFLDIKREIAFWPVGEKDKIWFTCGLTHTAWGANNICTRLSTMNARNLGSSKASEHRILTTHIKHDTTSKSDYNSDRVLPPMFEENVKSEMGDDGTRAHFELTELGNFQYPHYDYKAENKDTKQKIIPYAWKLIAKNTQQKRYVHFMYRTVFEEKEMLFKEENLYIFRVYPTSEEKNNSGKKYWPNDWQNNIKPVDGQTYVMIGSHSTSDHELVWCDWDGKGDFQKHSYYDIAYNKEHFGNPDHCMWEFLPGDSNKPK